MKTAHTFRLWDSKTNAMYPVSSIRVELQDDRASVLLRIPGEPTQITDSDQYQLLLGTELHDPNGTPIFEGDIVVIRSARADPFDKTNHALYRLVHWSGGAFWLQTIGANPLSEDLGRYHGDLEVVGNIFENPNLYAGIRDAGSS